jgi:glycosyltransferase involved in cell wall biosynthesis
MRILLVHNSYQESGGEDIVFEQERSLLQRAGYTVSEYRRSNWEIADYSAIDRIMLAPETVWSRPARRDFFSVLRREKPDIVHVHNTFIVISPSIFSACKQARIPVVQTLHNYRMFCAAGSFFHHGLVCEECLDHGPLRSLRYGCYRDSRAATAVTAMMIAFHSKRSTWAREIDAFFVLTDFARSRFIKAGLPAEKLRLKPNFICPDPGLRTAEGTYVLFVGRVSPEKGIRTLLSAFDFLPNHIPLRVVGDGPSRAELEQLTRGRRNNICFDGRLSRDETINAIKGARFLVFPSELYENFPLTILESFACGVPVIASAMGAMKEIVSAGRTGLHFRPGDARDLADKIHVAWSHPTLMLNYGSSARIEFQNNFTAEKNLEILSDTYESLLKRKCAIA